VTSSPERLTQENFVDHLAEALPEFAAAARHEAQHWIDDGLPVSVHQVVLHSFVAPVLEPLVRKERRTPEDDLLLVRIFDFVERMAVHGDDEVADAAQTGAVEHLAGLPELGPLLPILGPRTRAWAQEHRSV
jgi:hypothetical protein